ncbi:MAG: hypothetical protein WBL05_05595 [Brooklawnia sp.]|uniref:hypothetical protein n=1 Tax=Brooklawnia sp. TaxID=2699740 RepID=UPI003C77EB88
MLGTALHKPVMPVASTRPPTCAVLGTALHKPVMLALRRLAHQLVWVTDPPTRKSRTRLGRPEGRPNL